MRIAVFGLLLGSLCLAACDDDTDNAVVVHLPQATPFALRLVNNRALPAIVFDSINPQFRLEIVSGAFAINTNGTFTVVTRLRETRGFVIVIRDVACSGTFTNFGSTFTFVGAVGSLDCDRVFTGVVAGGVLSTTFRGVPVVYSCCANSTNGGTGVSIVAANVQPLGSGRESGRPIVYSRRPRRNSPLDGSRA